MCAVIANNHIYIMRLSLLGNRMLLSTTRIVIVAINHYLHIRWAFWAFFEPLLESILNNFKNVLGLFFLVCLNVF
jgi:hypothetical protein